MRLQGRDTLVEDVFHPGIEDDVVRIPFLLTNVAQQVLIQGNLTRLLEPFSLKNTFIGNLKGGSACINSPRDGTPPGQIPATGLGAESRKDQLGRSHGPRRRGLKRRVVFRPRKPCRPTDRNYVFKINRL